MTKARDLSQVPNASLGFKNRLINSDMRIDQRNAGASVTPTASTYTLDRWRLGAAVASKVSVQQSSVAPVGFTNSTLITTVSAYSFTSGQEINFGQRIEGFNTADLMWGTANAQTVTLSFWVRSSLTGTFGGVVKNSGGTLSYTFAYTINSANTWEQKSVTITGATTSTWETTSSSSLVVQFSVGAASDLLATSGAWVSGNFAGATGQTNIVGTSGATFYITGVQLEKGSTATSFDYRPYGTELSLCQRYYGNMSSTDVFSVGVGHNVTTVAGSLRLIIGPGFRASPTVTSSGTFTARGGGLSNSVTEITISTFDGNYPTLRFSATVSSNNAVAVFGPANGSLALSSEL
jgi:hypothetical protein